MAMSKYIFGGLHIEMAALRQLGDLLKGGGWTGALTEAEIATSGTADSLLSDKTSSLDYSLCSV